LSITEDHFVETEAGVGDIAHLKVGNTDYLLVGMEDGSLHLYNLTKNFGKSFTKAKVVQKGKSL
jgi:hypothetical protein